MITPTALTVYTYVNIQYCKRRNFSWGLIFVGKLPHENLYTRRNSYSSYSGLLLPTKINPHKNLTRKAL